MKKYEMIVVTMETVFAGKFGDEPVDLRLNSARRGLGRSDASWYRRGQLVPVRFGICPSMLIM